MCFSSPLMMMEKKSSHDFAICCVEKKTCTFGMDRKLSITYLGTRRSLCGEIVVDC